MSLGLVQRPGAQPARPADLRQSNCRILLRLLRGRASCSRADLVRLSGLSAPTVTSAVQALEKVGFVETLGEGKSSGGRPPEMLRFRAEHGYVAGADIGGTRLRMMLSDLNGKPVAHWKCTLDRNGKDPRSIGRLIHDGLVTMCSDASVVKRRVLHMTVGAPGITDVERGVVLSAPNLTSWNEVALRDLLEAETGVPVLAENDTNLAAVGEHWRGAATSAEDFVFIAIGTGVGAGVFLRGSLHHGATWSAGEIGYLGVSGEPREAPRMRRTGQLERLIGGAGIERSWLEQLDRSCRQEASLRGLRGAQIFDLAEKQDADALAVLRFAAGVLAEAVITIALLFNPALVVLGGGVGSHECLRREIEGLLCGGDFTYPEIRLSSLGSDAQLHGAISLSLSAIEGKLIC